MLNFVLTLIVMICLCVLCVYASNIKPLIYHRGKKTFSYNAENHKDISKHKGIGRANQNAPIRSNSHSHPLKTDSWTVRIAGHS